MSHILTSDNFLRVIIVVVFVALLKIAISQEDSFSSSSFGMNAPTPKVENCAELVEQAKTNTETLYTNVVWMRSFLVAAVGMGLVIILNRNMQSTTNLFYACSLFVLLFFLVKQGYAYYQMHVLAPYLVRTRKLHKRLLDNECIHLTNPIAH